MVTSIVPALSIVGRSDSGKTTFLEKLITELSGRGVCVATVKHHQHDYEMDVPGKDSWRHAQAGATLSMVSSPTKFSYVRAVQRERTVDELREEASRAGCDLLLTEGFKLEGADKLELSRAARGLEPACAIGDVVGLITDDADLAARYRAAGKPVFGLEDASAVADYIEVTYLGER